MYMDSQDLIEIAAKAADDLKAKNIKIIQIDMVSSIADWIMIGEGLSDVQVRSIIKSVEDRVSEKANMLPLRKEGINEVSGRGYISYAAVVEVRKGGEQVILDGE